jgi:hypothetical protein
LPSQYVVYWSRKGIQVWATDESGKGTKPAIVSYDTLKEAVDEAMVSSTPRISTYAGKQAVYLQYRGRDLVLTFEVLVNMALYQMDKRPVSESHEPNPFGEPFPEEGVLRRRVPML